MNKVRIFLTLDINTRLFFLEAFIFLGWARILKCFPFNKVAPSLGEHMNETSFSHEDMNIKVLKKVSQSIQIMSRYTFWESQCLVRAIAGMKMLERRRIESTLYLGTGKDEFGRFAAHAWLRSGHYYITGADGMEKYNVVSMFARTFSNENIEGEGNE
ncbi:stage V sporulation protein S [Bacillus sp. AFS073361]|uniref:lasso peptide biosynthesis B2 protein n=1 Tax=Bacillus sp. AFS073361 TaxID=2033511 RepID=UPI000BF5A761|nr:lasso peptide biosynthesis B2 protein [Bacillus sp. AFS073361]PFP29483.1 stage V sporulation protein S [Bacillus sp. AFS073361]